MPNSPRRPDAVEKTVEQRSLASLYRTARQRLAGAGIVSPELDVQLLVEWASGLSRLAAIADPDRTVTLEVSDRIDEAVGRRVAGEPVHRIIGAREFYGLSFRLSPETLEPRPDTETLVDIALPFLRERIDECGVADVLDLGTGTGAIAVALLNELPKLRAVGADIATGALAAARDNAEAAGVSRRFAAIESDWFAAAGGRFDLIVSNPPYISSGDIANLRKEVRAYDPVRALDGGRDGLDAYRIIAAQSARHLAKDGVVIVEIGIGQKDDVVRLFDMAGFCLEQTAQDLAGIERALMFRVAGPASAGFEKGLGISAEGG